MHTAPFLASSSGIVVRKTHIQLRYLSVLLLNQKITDEHNIVFKVLFEEKY